MLFCWQTYCIIFVIVIVHELLICAFMHIMVISYWKTHSYTLSLSRCIYILNFHLKYNITVVSLYYVVQENIANLKQNILCN